MRTLKSLNDKGAGGGDNGDGGLTILDCQLNGNTKTLPLRSCFRDIFTDFLG